MIPTAHPVLLKLEFFGSLPDEDRALIQEIVAQEHEVSPRTDLICEGDNPTVVHLITSGFACRYKRLADGKRQIVAFLIPGDFADLHAFIPKVMDHSISTLVVSRVVEVSKETIADMLERPNLARALLMGSVADSATLREWVATIGQRHSESRIAHLFCEVAARLRAVGMISEQGVVSLPLTQSELADSVGLSIVQANRSLQALRAKGLIAFAGGNLKILNGPRLEELCGFTPNYLYLS